MTLFLQHWEENIEVFLRERTSDNQLLATSLKGTQEEFGKVGQLFQVTIHFHPSHLQPNIINTSFCALVGLLLTKLNHYFNVSIETDTFWGLFMVTLKMGGTAP